MLRQLILMVGCASWGIIATAQSPSVATIVDKAMAMKPQTGKGGALYAKRCSRCHGAQGWGDGLEDIPSLAGQRELYLVTQLARWAAHERNGSTMLEAMGTADVNNPQAIRNLSAYLSRAPANPQPEHAEDEVPASGEQLFKRNCTNCHGRAAQGSGQRPIPALAGQHYDYTLIQMKSFAMGHRGAVKAPVINFAAGLSDEDQKGIADYLSRIQPATPSAGRK